MGAPGRPRPQEAGSARRVRPEPADRGDRGGQGRREGAEARGVLGPGRLGRIGARGRLGCDGAGRASGAETPAPPSAGPATPTPRAKMATWTAGEPGARGWEVGGEDGRGAETKKASPRERGGPAYFFFSFSPPAPSMANRCPRCLPPPAAPGLAHGLSAGSVRTRKERGKSRGGVRGETPPPPGRRGGSCKLRSLGSGSGS